MKWLKKIAALVSRNRPVAGWPPGVPEMTVEEIHQSRERGLQMRLKHPLFAEMADQICRLFDESGGINYVEFQVCSAKYGPMCVLIQKRDGETPAAQNMRLKERIKELEANK